MDVTAIFAGDILVKSREYLIPNDVVDVDGGIKAVRPPIIQPPPGIKLPLIDFPGSSWDFLTYFAPSETIKRPSSSSSDNSSDEEEVEKKRREVCLSSWGIRLMRHAHSLQTRLTPQVQYPLFRRVMPLKDLSSLLG